MSRAAHLPKGHQSARVAANEVEVIGPRWSVTVTGTIRYSLHDLQRFAGREPEGDDRLMSSSQAAKFLGYHHVTLIKWRRSTQEKAA